ncbi:hypothetical protein B7494_g2983 [Chlorociboria aeruginascens]|nr:hypothetical protein B7494_g2983 [Chlorociboria aeruginascens]
MFVAVNYNVFNLPSCTSGINRLTYRTPSHRQSAPSTKIVAADQRRRILFKMSSKYTAPTIEAILEDSEDEARDEIRGTEERENQASYPHQPSHEPAMSPVKANSGRERERERSRRSHKSSSTGSKHVSKNKARTTSSKRATRENDIDGTHTRHRRSHCSRSASASSTSSSDEEEAQNHRVILAATRSRLTSPSMVSNLTSLTTSTNKSSSSSGSNSTVTQASLTKRSNSGKRSESTEVPLSPAVPDPPDVFAFLENEGAVETLNGHDGENEHEQHENAPRWLPEPAQNDYPRSSLPTHLTTTHTSGSSASSSFHGDDFSEPPADNDTDRSTSPERSVRGHEDEKEPTAPADRASAKIAAQMAAAQQRQNMFGAAPSFGTPQMPRGNDPYPNVPPTTLHPRHVYQMKPQIVQRPEKLPVTGYELLASRLSTHSSNGSDGSTIKPMYRKFEALNHRLLLHLQDEISELEEQLRRLDSADTQSRRMDRHIVPASRRAAAQAGGELQWLKTDTLGRIGYKLAQYNQALASFHSTQSLSAPAPTDITHYREYLSSEHPIAEAETRFLDPADDLVSVFSDNVPSIPSIPSTPSTHSKETSAESTTSTTSSFDIQNHLQGLAAAIAVAVLIPILTFNVIPGFLGRMTVVCLVAGGVVGALMQSGVVGPGVIGREGAICGGIYVGVMTIIAGIVA